uniref:P2X purinoceptor 4-like n=1 Tax=Sinocyclocheilus anshuiensis TaxID=1608454 RepID=A0A671QL45_9TELE
MQDDTNCDLSSLQSHLFDTYIKHFIFTGVRTGRCVNYNDTVKTCEVLSWCPLEKIVEPPNPPLLADAENFTVLIKNNIHGWEKKNILINSSYLTQCVFSRKTDPDCPIFRLKDIVEKAEEDFQTMAVHIWWDCNLDMPQSWRVPRYTFRRLDNKDPENNVGPWYNFRFAKYYKDIDGTETKTLIKVYGIRFDVLVFGQAGKFNIIPTLLNISADCATSILFMWFEAFLMSIPGLSKLGPGKMTFFPPFGLSSLKLHFSSQKKHT